MRACILGHIVDRQHGGKDVLGDLHAICSDCNQGAKDLVQERPGLVVVVGPSAPRDGIGSTGDIEMAEKKVPLLAIIPSNLRYKGTPPEMVGKTPLKSRPRPREKYGPSSI